jgi:hypothetical protein
MEDRKMRTCAGVEDIARNELCFFLKKYRTSKPFFTSWAHEVIQIKMEICHCQDMTITKLATMSRASASF